MYAVALTPSLNLRAYLLYGWSLSNFRRSLETPLINRKVELEFKWKKHSVLSVLVNDNDNADANNMIFTIEDTKLYAPVVTLLAKDNQSYQNFLEKDLKDQCIGTNVKQNGE